MDRQRVECLSAYLNLKERVIMEKEVYTVKDIQILLDISKNTAYKLIKSGAFQIIRIGNTYRIPKVVFDTWLMSI